MTDQDEAILALFAVLMVVAAAVAHPKVHQWAGMIWGALRGFLSRKGRHAPPRWMQTRYRATWGRHHHGYAPRHLKP